jgi:stage II sporulation protein AB (anti-sigma F factor)
MQIKNDFRMTIDSKSINESFTRATVAAFAAQLDPTIDEISDIKMAVSEAVTNCIVHAYPESVGKIYIYSAILESNRIKITVRDKGCGIIDVKQAMEPLFTTLGGERAGLGFAVMESFMDKITVRSKEGKGTTVTMYKTINGRAAT